LLVIYKLVLMGRGESSSIQSIFVNRFIYHQGKDNSETSAKF